MRTKSLIILILLWACFFFVSKTAVHAEDFLFDYDVYYSIHTDGRTQVKQNITLTNLYTQYYADKFTLIISSERIENAQAADSQGPLSPQIAKQKGQTTISVPFTNVAVGVNKQLTFSLIYDELDIAEKKGRIWEILIPGIYKNESIRTYTVHVQAPAEFGKLAYITPPPQNGGIWALEDLKGGGIAAAYGDFQNFSFNLKYSLENPTGSRELQEITLPSDTNSQKIIISRISPQPLNVREDADGNWLAHYELIPHAERTIYVEGNALVYYQPTTEPVELTSSQRQLYTSEQKYWEQTPEIKKLAAKLKTPKNIYAWIVAHLKYDYSRISSEAVRLGAPKVLAQPELAVCTEFTDLFIALARSAGIPARSHEGFAYSSNNRLQPLSLYYDVLHAWPEYYDDTRRIWIQVDPTWGNTTYGVDYFSKLDFNHITFSVLGVSSEYPAPAGSFKTALSTKDVFVDFDAKPLMIPQEKFSIKVQTPQFLLPGKTKGIVTIRNLGKVELAPANLQLNSAFLLDKDIQLTDAIPPYGETQVSFTLNTSIFADPKKSSISAIFRAVSQNTTVTPLPVGQVAVALIILGPGIVLLRQLKSSKKHS